MFDHDAAVPSGRPVGYYRRKAAQWLRSAASFRRAAATDGGCGGYGSSLVIARSAIAMAAANRRAESRA